MDDKTRLSIERIALAPRSFRVNSHLSASPSPFSPHGVDQSVVHVEWCGAM